MSQKTYFGECSRRNWTEQKSRGSHWRGLSNSQLLIGKAVVINNPSNICTLANNQNFFFLLCFTFEQLQFGCSSARYNFHFGIHVEGVIPIYDMLFSWRKFKRSGRNLQYVFTSACTLHMAHLLTYHWAKHVRWPSPKSKRWKCILSLRVMKE